MEKYKDYEAILTELMYEYEEKAGILEFDAGMSREEAEKLALDLMQKKYLTSLEQNTANAPSLLQDCSKI